MIGRRPWRAHVLCAVVCFGCVERGEDLSELRDPEVAAAVRYDVSPPLRLAPATNAPPHPAAPLTLAALANFDGMGSGFPNFTVDSAPPDPNGDVGPNHYVQIVNTAIAVFDKQGGLLFGPVPTNTLWSGFGGDCEATNDGSGLVKYDRMADRWVVSQFSVTGSAFLECVAVSTTPDPTGSYARYAFAYNAVNDSPKMAIWPDAYYFTFNMFINTGFAGAKVCAYDRAAMLAGHRPTQQCFDTVRLGGLVVGDLDGPTAPPEGAPAKVVSLAASNSDLAFWRLHVDWAAPNNSTFVGPTLIPVQSYVPLCSGQASCVPQPGVTTQLDGLDDRLMYRAQYRNLGGHEALLVTHNVQASGGGGMRWYELRDLQATTPTVFQYGTYAPDANYRWAGSIAMDGSGGIAMGYSISSSTIEPGIRYTGRLASDALGTMGQAEGTLIDGTGVQSGSSHLTRWGDFSALAVDPVDDCTFWYTAEYMKTTGEFNWNTRIGSFQLPGCGAVTDDFALGADPGTATIVQGGAASFGVTTSIASGNAQSVALTISGLPQGTTATFNPSSVTAGSSSTLTLNVFTTAPGTYDLTVIGTGVSATHSVLLTVTVPPNDFTLAASPSGMSAQQGETVSTTIATTVLSGSAEPVALSISGLPAGASASFTPASVTAGVGSTLTVNTATSAPGSYVLTVTGSAPSATHSTSVALDIAVAVITNGGFETGTVYGWTATGVVSVVPSPHTGVYAVRLGSSTPSRQSAIHQTFMVPASGGVLSFWYQVVCPSAVAHDWASASLADNVTTASVVVLPHTCTNDGTWVQSLFDLAPFAGHSVTLTFANHDDNAQANPTYTLVDDLMVQ
jgi:hypothetical protein